MKKGEFYYSSTFFLRLYSFLPVGRTEFARPLLVLPSCFSFWSRLPVKPEYPCLVLYFKEEKRPPTAGKAEEGKEKASETDAGPRSFCDNVHTFPGFRSGVLRKQGLDTGGDSRFAFQSFLRTKDDDDEDGLS